MSNDDALTTGHEPALPKPSRFYWKLWGAVGLATLAIALSLVLKEWRYHQFVEELQSLGVRAIAENHSPQMLTYASDHLQHYTGFRLPRIERYFELQFPRGVLNDETLKSLTGMPKLRNLGASRADISPEVLRNFIQNTPTLAVFHLGDTASITPGVMDQIRLDHPHLSVLYHGTAFLGVNQGFLSFNPGGKILLQGVIRGSAAAEGGLMPGDMIDQLDGNKIPDFPTLVDYISRKQPGDRVVVTIERAGETLDIPCVLKGWE